MIRYKVKRADRASKPVKEGDVLYYGNDCYGCANDDSRMLGVDYIPVSHFPRGVPFFTIPEEDVERIEC